MSGVSDMAALERRYRRLLVWYPAEHRRVHAEEMVGVLLASARNGQRRPSLADALDLIKGGIQTRLRPAHHDGLDDGWRDTLAIASIAMPTIIALLYAVIFAWTAYHRVGDPAAGMPVAMTAVLAGWLLLVVLPPVLALRRFRRAAMLLYFVPVLFLAYAGAGPVVSGEQGGFFLAFLISAVAFVLSPGPRRAVQIMSAKAWVVVYAIGLSLSIPEIMLRWLAYMPAPTGPDRSSQLVAVLAWHLRLDPQHSAWVVVLTTALVAAGAALGLSRTLPSPVGKRLLVLLAVPAYPSVVSLTASAAGPGWLLGAEVVYPPTVLLGCLAVGLVWQSRRREHADRAS